MSDTNSEEETTVISRSELVYQLTAIGVNNTQGSYGHEAKELYQQFLNLPLCDIAPTWDYLSDRVKIDVITTYSEEFKTWVSQSGEVSSSHRVPKIALV